MNSLSRMIHVEVGLLLFVVLFLNKVKILNGINIHIISWIVKDIHNNNLVIRSKPDRPLLREIILFWSQVDNAIAEYWLVFRYHAQVKIKGEKNIYTACGQKWFCFCYLPYIFHIKPLIFITFPWSHSLAADFHEIFTFKNRINFLNIFM
jgi:hypothetical protein